VIQKIVSRRNPPEHFPDVLRRFALVLNALGARAYAALGRGPHLRRLFFVSD
jgi:hypothetical protein